MRHVDMRRIVETANITIQVDDAAARAFAEASPVGR